jgi:hypothetical protein
VADKRTELSIVLRTVDRATAGIVAINKRIDAATKPIRDFRKALGDLRQKSGLDDVIGGFTGVGSAIAGVLSKVAVVGAVVGGAVAGLFKLVDGFDALGDKAEAIGVSVDFLAQMRYAGERSGVAVQQLDASLQGFTKSLGQARAGTGRMASFLEKVSPALLTQLKATKSNEAAFELLAGAMAKLEDPAKRAALAQATLGDAALAPLFAKGPKGIKALRDRYLELAGSQKGAAEEAGKVDDSLKDLKATTDGVKAAIVSGLGPALKVLVDQLAAWFKENRTNVAEWAKDLGKKLPGAVAKLIDVFRGIVDAVRPFVDAGWKLKVILGVLAAIIVGPLIKAVVSLGIALLTTPVGWIVAGLAAIGAAAYLLIDNWDAVSGFFADLWDTVSGAFTGAGTVIKLVLLPITGAASLIIGAWGGIVDFFTALWDGVTGAFQAAWWFIKDIVDKVVGAVDKVVGAAKKIGALNLGSVSVGGDAEARFQALRAARAATAGVDISGRLRDVSAQSRDALAPPGLSRPAEARVTVDFKNAPPGTRVNTDPQSTALVDLSVGMQMFGFGS